MHVHTLKNGSTVIVTSSCHGFSFSDGSECPAQDVEVSDRLQMQRVHTVNKKINGMIVNEVRMTLDPDQQLYLKELCRKADVVLIPFTIITALREQGIREDFSNALAMNPTCDTQCVAPCFKVVDINNWSY